LARQAGAARVRLVEHETARLESHRFGARSPPAEYETTGVVDQDGVVAVCRVC
jgi:hypothetical protein